MALGERAGLEELERLVGQVEDPDQVRERGAAAPEAPAELLLGQAEVLDQRRAGARLVDGVELLARDVLDQRHLHALGLAPRREGATGTVSSPASRAARQRRSPAMIS